MTGRCAIESALHWVCLGLYFAAGVALVFSVVSCFFELGPRSTAWLSIGSFVVFIPAILILPFCIISSLRPSCSS